MTCGHRRRVAQSCSNLIPCSSSRRVRLRSTSAGGWLGRQLGLDLLLERGNLLLELVLQAFRLGKGIGRRCRREGFDRFPQPSLRLDQELQKRHQVGFLAPALAIACVPPVGVVLDPLPHELDIAAGAGVLRLQFQAVTKGRNRRLQLVEDLGRLSGATFSGWSPASRRASSAASVPRLKWAEAASPLSCARPAFRYDSRADATSPLRCEAQAWSNAAIAALPASPLSILLAGGREPVPRLVEFALAIPPQSFANRLRRIVGPTGSGKGHHQDKCRRDRQGGLAALAPGSSAPLARGSSALLVELVPHGIETRERVRQQGQHREREEDLELVRATNPLAALLVAAAPALKIFRVQFSQVVGTRSRGDVDARGLERDLLEERAVELAPDLLALGIRRTTWIRRPAGCVRRGRRLPGRR